MITVFTPTYNRGYIIERLYKSLCNQTYSDFEWLVVDDGSQDNTGDLFKKIINEKQINIKYIKTTNGGKHRAINHGIKLAKGELFFIVDSDDYLTDNSLERINYWYKTIENKDNFCGVSGLMISPDGKLFGVKKKFDVIDCTDIQIRKYLDGDRAQVYKTSILAQYPFPEYEGEKFISEGIVWYRMAQKYKVRFFYEGIYVAEYRPDGLTYNIRKNHRNSPKGSMIMFKERMLYDDFFKERVKAGINYWRSSIEYKGKISKELKMPWWGYIYYPLGLFFYLLDKKREKN